MFHWYGNTYIEEYVFPREGNTSDMCFLCRGTHITRDMFFLGRGTHITRDMCFQGSGAHVSRVGEHISLAKRCWN